VTSPTAFPVLTGYLRNNIGFDGVCMTDSMGMAGITSGYTVAQATVLAIQAGNDLLSLPPDLDGAISALKSAVSGGTITESRIDQSVLRILKLKRKYGIFDNPFVDANAASTIVGSPDHRASELTAARAAITLVKNTGNALPLNLTADQKVLLVTVTSSTETTTDAAARFAPYIAAKHANMQSMPISESPNSTTRNSVKTAAASCAAIVVGTSRANLYSSQITLVNDLIATGKPVICVGLREPYELASFPTVPAYLCTYNYKTCGFAAAADVVFGDYNPGGLLPVSIPGTSYAFGWGLNY